MRRFLFLLFFISGIYTCVYAQNEVPLHIDTLAPPKNIRELITIPETYTVESFRFVYKVKAQTYMLENTGEVIERPIAWWLTHAKPGDKVIFEVVVKKGEQVMKWMPKSFVIQ